MERLFFGKIVWKCPYYSTTQIYIYQMLLSKAPYSAFRLYIFFLSVCVPLELNPQPFALPTQCSTTEPQKHFRFF